MNNTRSEAVILINIVRLHTHFADQANSTLNITSSKFYYSVHNILSLFTNLNNLDLANAILRYDRFAALSHSREKRFLGTFLPLGKAPVRFVTSVLLSSCVTAASFGRIFIKFDVGDYYGNLSIKTKFG